ncbi:MAG: hypothetical protein ACI88A_004457 [Paraglaciecola sp.]|jgi:hypothetical protein
MCIIKAMCITYCPPFINHLVVSQPFYLRQLVARKAHKVIREQGVRDNDLSTFVMSNRRVSGVEQLRAG